MLLPHFINGNNTCQSHYSISENIHVKQCGKIRHHDNRGLRELQEERNGRQRNKEFLTNKIYTCSKFIMHRRRDNFLKKD